MSKRVFIAEKPSVAREFANSLGLRFTSRDGYMEAEDTIVTWCVGHLVTMCYPDAYDPKYKKWSLSTIPFIPDVYKYQVIDGVKKQFGIVKKILTDKDVDTTEEKGNTSTALLRRKPASPAKGSSGSGSIRRQKRRYSEGYAKPKIYRNMIILVPQLISVPKKTI